MYAQQCCTVQNKDIARVGMQYDEVLQKCVGNTQTRGYNVNSFVTVPFLCMLLHTQVKLDVANQYHPFSHPV